VPSAPAALVFDFDGTITERDLLQPIAYEFGDVEVVTELDRALDAGEITLRDEIVGEYATVQASFGEVLEWVFGQMRIRPGFPELLELVARLGWRSLVVSSGFHELIEPIFERHGIEAQLHANRVDPRPDGWRVGWRYDDGCPSCGQSCKRSTVERLTGGAEVVYVGDGYSDRCAAEAADRVFAIRGLARYLERKGIAFETFSDFRDVAVALSASPARGRDGTLAVQGRRTT
jgi:2-hydroxy-3-keto-5-methylthiopentenyl-1-phosphate phosphatase